MTSEGVLLNTRFLLTLYPALLFPSLSSIGATWNLTWPLTPDGIGGHPRQYQFLTDTVSSITFPKFELNRSNLKFDLTFDPGWHQRVPSSIHVSYWPCLQHYFPQVWAQSEQLEIWPDLWPRTTFEGVLLYAGFVIASHPASLSPNLSSIGAISNLTWPLTSGHLVKLLPSLGPSPPTTVPSFVTIGPRAAKRIAGHIHTYTHTHTSFF